MFVGSSRSIPLLAMPCPPPTLVPPADVLLMARKARGGGLGLGTDMTVESE